MNKEEKALAKKILDAFYSSTAHQNSFTREENIILERWRVLKIINEDAFPETTHLKSDQKTFRQRDSYPFTEKGDEDRKKHWYLKFRNNIWIMIIRDGAAVLTLWLTFSKLLGE
jgi:hypothetical protein